MKRRLFDEILGHLDVRKSLHQLVVKNRLSPLTLFVGPEGVGKKKIALALAQVLVCEVSDRACGDCGPCQRLANEQSESLLVIRPDGLQIKVEQAREVIEFCNLQNSSKARIVVIDQAERLNAQSSNSLLKLFEEPPPKTYFFLIAPSPQSLLPTVRSRAQVVRFGVLQKADLLKKMNVEDWILESSGGRLDRIEALQSEELMGFRKSALELLQMSRRGQFDVVLDELRERVPSREAALWVIKFWREFFRDVWAGQKNWSGAIHPDLSADLNDALAGMTDEDHSDVAESIQRLENGIHGNLDTQLNLEVFLRDFNKGNYSGARL